MTKDEWGTPLEWLTKEEVLNKWPMPTKQLHKQGSNLVDGEGQLYFQCNGCEAIFDPATKSFKTLHDSAHKQGWMVKWNEDGHGYKIYCVKCGY